MSRILFVMLHPGFVRYYEDGLRGLAAAGHDVHVAFEVSRAKLGEDATAARLATWSPRLTCGPAPERAESVRAFLSRGDRTATRTGETPGRVSAAEAWESLATTVRLLTDYLQGAADDVTLTWTELDRVVGGLPASALRHRGGGAVGPMFERGARPA